jgi:anaerobic ribonucleoside-triphosphate reductase activating protein
VLSPRGAGADGDMARREKAVTSQLDLVNVAETCVGTRALGPGIRSVVWVQGCPLHCAGCIAPEWIPQREARLVTPWDLAAELLADTRVSGLTLSGGEPMLQATPLAAMVRSSRRQRDVTVICYSGFTLGELRERPPAPGVAGLLEQTDVLIDGGYVAAANDGRGLRGSSNQVVHHLTGRLADADDAFVRGPRTAEIRVRDRSLLLVGVPPPGLARDVDLAARQARQMIEASMLRPGDALTEGGQP